MSLMIYIGGALRSLLIGTCLMISIPCVLAVNIGQLPKAPCSSGEDGHHHLREPLDGDSGFKHELHVRTLPEMCTALQRLSV